MEFLRHCLDDPEAGPCGRCDLCAGPRFEAAVSAPSLPAAQAFLGRAGITVEPRRMWPTGLKAIGVSGKIPAEQQTLPGRAIGRLTDLGWGTRLRGMLTPGVPDQPATPELLAAIVEVLRQWASGGPDGAADGRWAQRPSRRRGDRLAQPPAPDRQRRRAHRTHRAATAARHDRHRPAGAGVGSGQQRPPGSRAARLVHAGSRPAFGAGRVSRPGAARRRPRRLGVDDGDGGPRAPGRRRARGAAVRPRHHQLGRARRSVRFGSGRFAAGFMRPDSGGEV